jgi:hypothetical protein
MPKPEKSSSEQSVKPETAGSRLQKNNQRIRGLV